MFSQHWVLKCWGNIASNAEFLTNGSIRICALVRTHALWPIVQLAWQYIMLLLKKWTYLYIKISTHHILDSTLHCTIHHCFVIYQRQYADTCTHSIAATYPAVFVSATNLPWCIGPGIKVTSVEWTWFPSNFPPHNRDTSWIPVRCWGQSPGFSLPARILVMWIGLHSIQLRATALRKIWPPWASKEYI